MTHHEGTPGAHDDEVAAVASEAGGTTPTGKDTDDAGGATRVDGRSGDNDEFVYPVDHGSGTQGDTNESEGGYVESTDHGDRT